MNTAIVRQAQEPRRLESTPSARTELADRAERSEPAATGGADRSVQIAPSSELATVLSQADPATRSGTVLALQQTVGNTVVQRLLRTEAIASTTGCRLAGDGPARPIQRQEREELYIPYELPAYEPANDPAVLAQAERVEDLFDLYASRQLMHRLPGTTQFQTFGRTWIGGSVGAGLIRQEIRRRLETKVDRPQLRQWFLDYANQIAGGEGRKRELRLVVEDVFAAPSWRPADQIAIDPDWSANKQRYARLWNEKGQLFADLAAGLNPAVEPYVIAGITAAETGQRYFEAGRAVARFEAHVFWKRWGKTTQARQQLFQQHFSFNQQTKWQNHRWRRDPGAALQPYHGNQDREWAVLEFARTLDADADVKAIESASFGAGQTMGFNYARAGFGSALELLEHCQTQERAQVEGVVGYIDTITPAAKKTQVINGIIAGNFLPLSQAYGPANPAAHAQRIANAVASMRTLVEQAAAAAAP